MCLMTTAANRIRFSQEPSPATTSFSSYSGISSRLHISCGTSTSKRVEIVGGLSGHSIAFGRAERHEAAGEFIGFRFAVRNEFLGEYAQLTDELHRGSDQSEG